MSLARCLRPSARRVLALMVFGGQIQNYMMRVNLSILIVAMVKDPVPEGKIVDTGCHLLPLDLSYLEVLRACSNAHTKTPN